MPTIEVHQVTEERPDLLEATTAVRAVTEREVNPDDPPAPAAEVAGELFVETMMHRRIGWVALLDGAPVGELGFSAEKTEGTPTWSTSSGWRSTRPGAVAGWRTRCSRLVVANTHRPELADQGDTGVVEAHRGRGLGRWLKAENLRLALETEPRVRVVQTYNAESNPWMLDINVAMGFRPHIGYQAFQGDIATVGQVLG